MNAHTSLIAAQPRNTYTVSLAQFIELHGDRVAIRMDAKTGVETAYYRSAPGASFTGVLINTPLCDYCDQPSDGFCPNCDVPAHNPTSPYAMEFPSINSVRF